MNKRIGVYSSIINAIAVLLFLVFILTGFEYGSYITCIFIALSFVPMMCSYAYYSDLHVKTAGYIGMGFSIIYATLILIVYYAQVTAIVLDQLNEQAKQIIDYKQFGLFFSYDLLGYGIMALATLFAGLTVGIKNRRDKVLKYLLIIHGLFFISSFVIPLLGVFDPQMKEGEWIGSLLLGFWCLYYTPIAILSGFYFYNKD